MDSFLQEPEKNKGINKILIGALIVGVLVVGAIVWVISLNPSTEQLHDQVLESAYREGSPEFALYTKKIAIQYDQDRTIFSLTGMGTIMMSIGGTVRNMTGKTLTGLEVKASVVDSFGKVIREKTALIIPKQAASLAPDQSFPITVVIEGFSKDDDRAQVRWKVTAIKVE